MHYTDQQSHTDITVYRVVLNRSVIGFKKRSGTQFCKTSKDLKDQLM